MDALNALFTRNSNGKLTVPAPSADELNLIQGAALRAPDHGKLRPWRFLVLDNDLALNNLGELFLKALLNKNSNASEEKQAKALAMPKRAPLMIIAIANCDDVNKKIPREEKLISAGAACEAMLLACHALGYAAMWRTGDNAYDDVVKQGLGLSAVEEIVGFIYIGTPSADYKPLDELATDDFFKLWS